MGRVELAGQPYQEIQPDADGNPRRVWVFPLRLVDTSSPVPIPEEFAILKQKQKEKQAKRLTDEVLWQRINFAPREASTRQVSTTTYERNPYVAEYAKRRAKGKCQLCKQPAPFNDRDGKPFLEVHHIVWLSRGGEDTINNTVALCPNCHRKMHVLDLAADREKLQKELQLINGRNS
ncbi:MAG: HNH endonuclease [Thermoanaerobacteraceae bacterium]|nr:HNH endonuclease [Thermoanaerobacteraceae bacterium]